MSNNQHLAVNDALSSGNTVSIKGDLLKAAASIAGDAYKRPHLECIHISRGSFGTILIATNGIQLGVTLIDDQPVSAGEYSFQLKPLKTSVVSAKGKYEVIFLDDKRALIRTPSCDLPSFNDDNPYPDWRRVVPSRLESKSSRRNVWHKPQVIKSSHDFMIAATGLKGIDCFSIVTGSGDGDSTIMYPCSGVRGEFKRSFVVMMPVRTAGNQTAAWEAPEFLKVD